MFLVSTTMMGSSLTIGGAAVEQVSRTEFLGVNITEELSRRNNTSSLAKKAQQRLHFVRKLKRAGAPSPIMHSFYRGAMENILTSCITVWFRSCAASNRKTLQRIIGASLPSLLDIYNTRLTCRARSIVGDPFHPSNCLFTLLPSGRRFHSLRSNTTRLKNSFLHQAELSPIPPLSPLLTLKLALTLILDRRD